MGIICYAGKENRLIIGLIATTIIINSSCERSRLTKMMFRLEDYVLYEWKSSRRCSFLRMPQRKYPTIFFYFSKTLQLQWELRCTKEISVDLMP